MASRLTARLTLFSGNGCSLCDVAKAELAKVKQSRPSLNLPLTTINIHSPTSPDTAPAPGHTYWAKKYVHWIPALHLEGKEIAKGRWDAGDVEKALDAWVREKEGK